MSEPHDIHIDTLVRRLRDAAATLNPDQPPIAPPIGDWHRRLAELRERLGEEALLPEIDAQRLASHRDTPCLHPETVSNSEALKSSPCNAVQERLSLGVLISPEAEDETFVEGLYQRLLGRVADVEGKAYYLQTLSRHGRLFVLGEFLQSQEAEMALEAQPQELEYELTKIRDTWRRYHPPGRFKGAASRLLNMAWKLRARYARQQWRLQSHQAHQRELWAEIAAQRDAQQQLIDAVCQVDEVMNELLPAWHQERRLLSAAILEMDDRQQYFGHRQDHEYARQQALWEHVAMLRRHLGDERHANPVSAAGDGQTSSSNMAPPDPTELDAYYLAFEDAFRGPEADIAAHLDHYRGDWTRARQAGERALDLGCGRGEWLRLLDRAGFTPRGVDLNVTMVDHCRERGFEVAHQDAIAALEACERDSLALISGFHIAEHLPFEALFRLVAQASRALAPGGMLILETPNPENLIVASYSFYHDLTHRNPLTPPTLQFLFTFHGFAEADIKRFNPPSDHTRVPGDSPVVERLNHMLVAPMDYAVVGVKPRNAKTEEGAV